MQRNNAAVWRDTQGIMKEWFGSLTAQQDAERSSLDEDTVATTLRLTLVSDSLLYPHLCVRALY